MISKGLYKAADVSANLMFLFYLNLKVIVNNERPYALYGFIARDNVSC